MIGWMCVLIGFKFRNQIAAVVVSLVVLVAWIVLPLIGSLFVFALRFFEIGEPFLVLFLTSPLTFIVANQFRIWDDVGHSALTLLIINSGFYSMFCFLFRHLCLSKADRCLNHSDAESVGREFAANSRRVIS